MTHLEHYALRWELDHTFWLWAKAYADSYDRGDLLRLMDRVGSAVWLSIEQGETRHMAFLRAKRAFLEECRICLYQRRVGWKYETA